MTASLCGLGRSARVALPLGGRLLAGAPDAGGLVGSGSEMPWLLRDGDVLAAAEVASSFGSRLRGLLGRDRVDGALVLRPAKSVHTIGMRFAIDVAFCDRELRVLSLCTMRPHRMGRPRRRAKVVIEAEAGAFERWRLRPGDQLELRE